MQNNPEKHIVHSRLYRIAVSLFIVIYLAPNLWAVYGPHEDWPYTSVPVFAHFVGRDVPRYRFRFVAELESSPEVEVGYYSVGANWALMRFFFKEVYGSVEANSLYNLYPNDTPEEFSRRLSVFFADFARELVSRPRFEAAGLRAIRLEVARLGDGNEDIERHRVGFFDPKSGVFEHTWPREKGR